MNTKVLLKAINVLWKFLWGYIKSALGEQLKEAFKLAFEEFRKVLWENIKGDVNKTAIEALNYIQAYYVNPDIQSRKEAIVQAVIKEIKLPFILKPFRKLICNFVIGKIDALVQKLIDTSINYLS